MLPASNAMVVTAQPEATEVGADTLRAGGNAVDAAIAIALTQGVVDPLMTGIAGFGSMGVFMPGREHRYLDFHAPSPASVRPDMWADLIESETRDGFGFVLKGRVNDIGYQSIAVPAALKAYAQAHARYGVLPWSEVVRPAIEWARNGWVVRQHVNFFWSDAGQMGRAGSDERIAFSASGRKMYCTPAGAPKPVGAFVQNPDLADTLEAIAREGAEVFYRGEIAARIAEDMKANGGLVSRADLEGFEPRWVSPLWGEYRGWRVSTNQPPGGGIMLMEMLNILSRFDLNALGHNSTEYIRVVAEAMKQATVDKDRFVGDPSFVDVPVERLLSREHAEAAADGIRRGSKVSVPRVGGGWPSKDTTQLCVIDGQGNCVTMTHSLGMPSGVITDGLGFMYNGCMAVFDPRPGRAGSLAPGKARFSSMCPSIFFRGDRPGLVIGAPGATQIAMGVLQACLNVIDFGMSAVEAVSFPRIHCEGGPVFCEARVQGDVVEGLRALGHEVRLSPISYDPTMARAHAILLRDGKATAGADPRGGGGVAIAW